MIAGVPGFGRERYASGVRVLAEIFGVVNALGVKAIWVLAVLIFVIWVWMVYAVRPAAAWAARQGREELRVLVYGLGVLVAPLLMGYALVRVLAP